MSLDSTRRRLYVQPVTVGSERQAREDVVDQAAVRASISSMDSSYAPCKASRSTPVQSLTWRLNSQASLMQPFGQQVAEYFLVAVVRGQHWYRGWDAPIGPGNAGMRS